MSKYERYPNYKDSGVKWLGKIPEQWVVSRVKFYSNIKGRIGFRGYTKEDLVEKEEGALVIGASEINNNAKIILKKPQYITWHKYYESPEIILKKNDVLFVQRGSVGKVAYIDYDIEEATINPSLVVLKKIKLEAKYLKYFLMSDMIKSTVEVQTSNTAVPMITQEQIGNYILARPPKLEQQTIANYLDIATANIDTLIKKQTRLIELLKEKRQAVISHAVTKGLDPNAKMKDSGVEWLGDVPEHWIPSSLKHLAIITLGKMLTPNDKGSMILKPYLRAKNIQWLTVRTDDVNKMWFDFVELKKLRLKKNDLLVSEGGEVGRTCIWSDELEECYIQNSVNRVRIINGNPRFYLYQFYAAGHYGYFDSIVNRISIAHLTKEKLGDSFFVKAPVAEQIAIANYLDTQTTKIDTLIKKSNQAITLLKERRTALISAAVTGKIDVREIA